MLFVIRRNFLNTYAFLPLYYSSARLLLAMTNQEIAHLLRNVAAAYAISNEKKYYFQIVAYQKAAEAIEKTTAEAKDLYKEGKLMDLPGIGPSIQAHLTELFTKGSVKHFETILKEVPETMFPLLDIPSFGPKKAYKLVTTFNLKNPKTVMQDLEKIAKEGKIATLEGFGEKSQADILQALAEYHLGKTKSGRMVLPYAKELADKMITYLKKDTHVLKAYTLGSLRRSRDTIGDIDIAVASENPEAVIAHFVSYPYKERIIEQGDKSASLVVSSGKQIDLMVQSPEAFGSLLQHFTGSKAHNIKLRELALKKGLSLSEYGIKKKMASGKWRMEEYPTEELFYKALGLDWIPPEIREDTGEIELAAKNQPPKLVELKDIKGDFHLHSNFLIEPSHDLGADTFTTMTKKAKELGYTAIGFSEHNPSVSRHTEKEIYSLIKKRNDAIDQAQLKYKSVRIFKLLEIDILSNGKLAINDSCLSLLDGSLVSIHSSFSTDKNKMTKRVLAGMSHPKAKILSHPTGRILNERAGYELEWERIFSFCKENDKALEINAWPTRLDLPDSIIREAVRQKVLLIINTDSHAVEHMQNMPYGVQIARRGWATNEYVINTWTLEKLTSWFRK
jgi:DNA polymerase (family 10)